MNNEEMDKRLARLERVVDVLTSHASGPVRRMAKEAEGEMSKQGVEADDMVQMVVIEAVRRAATRDFSDFVSDTETPTFRQVVRELLRKEHNRLLDESGFDGRYLTAPE